jgi:hypothetical protein
MTKSTSVAGEVDAYCTKCKLDLNHRIIAMVGDTIKKVECLTCGGHHLYRAPRGAGPTGKSKRGSAKRPSKAAAAAAARNAAAEQRKRWEQAIMGRPAEDFTAYQMAEQFTAGQLVRHAKFGDGVVTAVRHDLKVQVLFEAGERTLVHGR